MKLSNVPVVTTSGDGVTDAVRDELVRLHEGWMGLVFPRQRTTADSVLGKWRPGTALGRLKYGLWGALGLPVLALVYAVAVVGSPLRFAVRRVAAVADTWGLAGVVWFAAFVGAGASGVAWLWSSRATFLAVTVAAGVATLAVSLSMTLARVRGRPSTVALAYPLGVVALVVVPVAVATYGTAPPGAGLERAVELLATEAGAVLGPHVGWRPDLPPAPAVVASAWAGAAALSGWLVGVLVTVTDLARPVES